MERCAHCGQPLRLTLAVAVDNFFATNTVRGHSYRSHAKHFIEHFGVSTALADITPTMVRQWRVARLKTCAKGTVHAQQSFLSAVFRQAIEDEQVAENPVRRLGWVRVDNMRTNWIDPETEARLRPHFSDEQWEAVQFAIHTGLRKAEQWALVWQDVDWAGNVIRVVGGKGDRSRSVAMHDRVHAILDRRKRAGLSRPFPGGNAWTGYHLRKVRKLLGMPELTWHVLGRHTFASRLVNDGEDIYTVQEILGHSSLMTTRRYAHLSQGKLRTAVNRIVTVD